MKNCRFSCCYADWLVCWLFVYFSGKLLFDTVSLLFELFSLAVIAFCAILMFLNKEIVDFHRAKLYIIALIFSVYVVINAIIQDTPAQIGRAIYEYVFYILIFFAILYLLPKVNLRKCIKVVAFWGVLIACLSWYEFITKNYLLTNLDLDANAGFRAIVFSRSFLSHGMILGFFALSCMDICYAEKKPLWFLMGIFCYLSILTTASRGPLVACGVALVLQFLLNTYISSRRSAKRFWANMLLFAGIIAVFILMFSSFQTGNETVDNFLFRMRSIFNWTGDAGNVGRLQFWENAIALFKTNILFGIGPSKTGSWGDGALTVTESGILKRLCELGLIGFICYYYFVICIIANGIRAYKKQNAIQKQPMVFWFSLATAVLINDITVQSTEEIMISFFMWTAFAGLETSGKSVSQTK